MRGGGRLSLPALEGVPVRKSSPIGGGDITSNSTSCGCLRDQVSSFAPRLFSLSLRELSPPGSLSGSDSVIIARESGHECHLTQKMMVGGGSGEGV